MSFRLSVCLSHWYQKARNATQMPEESCFLALIVLVKFQWSAVTTRGGSKWCCNAKMCSLLPSFCCILETLQAWDVFDNLLLNIIEL